MVTSHRFEPDSKNRLIVKGAALGALGNFFYFFIAGAVLSEEEGVKLIDARHKYLGGSGMQRQRML